MTKTTFENNEQSTRIKVPEGRFCGKCPYLSGNRCTKESAQVDSERMSMVCNDKDIDVYFMCKYYDPVSGRF